VVQEAREPKLSSRPGMGFAGPSGIPTRHCCCASRPSPFQCPLERPSCDRFSLRRITSRRCVLQLPRLRDVRTLCCVRPRGVGGAGWGMSPSRLSLLGVATSSVLRCRSCSRSRHRKRRILRRGLSILAKRKIVPRDLRAGLPDTSWSMRPDALASGFLSWGCRRSPLRRSRSGSPLPDSTLRPSPSDRDATPDLVPPSWFCATSTVYSSSDRVRVLHLTADLEVRPVSDLCEQVFLGALSRPPEPCSPDHSVVRTVTSASLRPRSRLIGVATESASPAALRMLLRSALRRRSSRPNLHPVHARPSMHDESCLSSRPLVVAMNTPLARDAYRRPRGFAPCREPYPFAALLRPAGPCSPGLLTRCRRVAASTSSLVRQISLRE
jgi:hypothetical protein